jgi:hypothetical protein
VRIDDLIEALLRAREAGAVDVCVDVTPVMSSGWSRDVEMPSVRGASTIGSIGADGAVGTTVVLWLDADA